MVIDYTRESNGDVTVTPKINKRKLAAAIITIALLAIGTVGVLSNNNKKKIKEIKAKITAIQAEKEAAIADSLRSRNISLTDIECNRAWNADIENRIVQCSKIWNRPLGELYSKEEIKRMNVDFQARRVKRAKEMHHVPGFAMGVLWHPCIDEKTTVKDLVNVLKHIDPAQGEMYFSGTTDGRAYELWYPIRFPDKNPNIIVDKEGNWCLTDANLMLKFLDKEQKANLMNSALTLYTANEEKEVVKDIRDYFDRQTDPQIQELLKELGQRDYMAALDMQRKILEQTYKTK